MTEEDTESYGDISDQLFKLAFDNRMFKTIILGYSFLNILILVLLISILLVNLKGVRI